MKGIHLGFVALWLLTGCAPISTAQVEGVSTTPTPAQLVAQGQAAVAAAGGAITDVGAAACLAQGILGVVPTPATQAAAVATGLLCNWTNPVKTAAWYARWHRRS